MNQFVKKIIFVVLLSLSLNSWGATYFFLGTGTAGNNLGDWNTSQSASYTSSPSAANGNPSNFTTAGDVFDFDGWDADLAGMTIGAVTFRSTFTSAPSTLNNSGTVYVTSQNAPTFTLGRSGRGQIILDLSNAGLFQYSYTGSGSQTINSIIDYWNLECTNTDKTCAYLYVKNNIKISNNISVVLTKFEIESSTTFTVGSQTLFEITDYTQTTPQYLWDKRTVKTYPGIWKFSTVAGTIEQGTYDNLYVNSNVTVPGNITVNDKIDLSIAGTNLIFDAAAAVTITVKGQIQNTNGSTGGRITGNSNANLICSTANSTLYFAQTSSSTRTLGTLSLSNGASVNLGTDLNITNNLDLGANTLNINGKTLTINGTLTTNSGAGKLIGSESSNLICSTTNNTLYFDQSSASNSTLSTLAIANNASIALGNNLRISNLDLGANSLTLGANTLTFIGTSTQPISRTTGTINPANSTIKYAQTSTNGSNTLPLSAFSANIYNLTLDFANGGTLTPDGSMTIGNALTMSTANNYFNINGTTLTINGGVTNTNGSSGGKFIGSTTSNINCAATSTLYFDQTSLSSRTIKNLNVQGNSVTITIGNPLIITGGTSSSGYGTVAVIAASASLNTDNNLTLESNAYGTARIGESLGTINGRYYAEQYFPATREFRFIGVPVVGATALQWRNNGDNSTSNRGIQITGSSTSSDSFDISTLNNPSAWYFSEPDAGDITDVNTNSTLTDDPGWKKITKGGNTYALPNGRGFRVLVRGDRKTSLTSSTPALSATTIWAYGSYPTRNINNAVVIGISNSGTNKINEGLNLISNPYPSAINWNAIGRSSKVDNGYALYRPATASKAGQYVAWNGVLGDAGQYISANQAFFVYCNTDNDTGTLLFYENAKYNGAGGSFFSEKISNHMRINLLYDSVYNSNAYLHFSNWGSTIKDAFDVPQFYNNGTNIATMDLMGNKYNINTLPLFDTMATVPLSVEGTPEAKLNLSFYDLTSFDNTSVTLTDNYLKKTIDISEGTIYSFEITKDSLTSKNGRFYLNFRKNTTAKTILIEENIANIFPIPVKDDLTIELNKKFKNAEFIVSNSIGQQIKSGNITQEKNIINTKNLESGIYVIKIKSSNSVQTIKFIK